MQTSISTHLVEETSLLNSELSWSNKQVSQPIWLSK